MKSFNVSIIFVDVNQKCFINTFIIQIFSFWAQYGQNALSTPITMYKTDLPTLPIFGQHLRVFPYLIHIRSSHSGWQV